MPGTDCEQYAGDTLDDAEWLGFQGEGDIKAKAVENLWLSAVVFFVPSREI